jgi:hypothetical protein
MVNMMPVPAICWDEGLSPEQEQALAHAVLRLIQQRQGLAQFPAGNGYFFIPNPAPYAQAETTMLAALPNGLAQQVRVISLPRGGKCYGVAGDDACLGFMPHAFHLGPPELTILALDYGSIALANDGELERFVAQQLAQREPVAQPCAVVGLHFDSGDLVDVF